MNTRRQFLIRAPLSLLVATAALKSGSSQTPSQTPTTPGAPPTFGTGAGSGPAVTPETFAEAEKLMQVTMTAAVLQFEGRAKGGIVLVGLDLGAGVGVIHVTRPEFHYRSQPISLLYSTRRL